MMSASAARACRCDVYVLTDVDTNLPFPTFKYATTRRRLMLWYLEIAACYVESDAFDCDTVMLDSDQLVYGDLNRFFAGRADLGLCVREPPKGGPGFPILNGVQFWAYRGKARLGPFFRRLLATAEALPEEHIIWGADTEALKILLSPLERDGRVYARAGITVRMLEADHIIQALATSQLRDLDKGRPFRMTRPVLDFRNLRKVHMRRVYEATLAEAMA
jgi:hypothetical protein